MHTIYSYTSLLEEELNDFLWSESILNEGKLFNKLRWKLQIFSLRFLKNEQIDNFIRAYFSDKNGQDTNESREWLAKSRKEKLKKMQELANTMPQEDKDKIINSQAARQMENIAVNNGIAAGMSVAGGVGQYAAVTGLKQMDRSKKYYNMAQAATSAIPMTTFMMTRQFDQNIPDKQIVKGNPWGDKEKSRSLNLISTIMMALCPFLYAMMWGALIVAGTNLAKGARALHRATTIRRDEAFAMLLNKKKLEKQYIGYNQKQLFTQF